jgi:hypothetical protein
MKTTKYLTFAAASLAVWLTTTRAAVISSGTFDGTYTSVFSDSLAFTPVAGSVYGVSAAMNVSNMTWAGDDQTANLTALSFSGSPTVYGNGQSWYTYGGSVVDRFVNSFGGGGNQYIGGTTGSIYSGFSLDTTAPAWTVSYYYGGTGFDANSVYQGATAYGSVTFTPSVSITAINFTYNPYNAAGPQASSVVSDFKVTAVGAAIPEPSTYAMIFGGGGLLFALVCRKRQTAT